MGAALVLFVAFFAGLEIPVGDDAPIFFTHEAESSNYHGIGVVDGENHGVDPGKWQVYKHVGAQRLLADRKCDVFFIWDPDGDRFNMVTVAPADAADAVRDAGLEVDDLDEDRCLVFFKPNQIYFLLTAAKIAALAGAGELDRYQWIVASTWPTSRSIGEVATSFSARGGARLLQHGLRRDDDHGAVRPLDGRRQHPHGQHARARVA